MIRSILFAVVFYGLTAIFAVLYLPFMLLPRRMFSWLTRLWVRMMMGIIRLILGIRYELRGTGNIPDGPAVFASKHQSAWDVLVFNLIIPDCAYVLKRELFRIPLWGWYVWRVGMVGIDRRAGAKALKKMVVDAKALLDSGRSIVIFPQGTRTTPGESRPYLPGAAALYLGAEHPVVPVALNSGSFWPRRTFVKKPGVVTVEFLPPIPPGLDRRTFLKHIEAQIEPATQRLEHTISDGATAAFPVAE
ncbi:MAG: lysophospholipid acyltransferase family protein [Alphaproteobacteria bacterium]